MRRNAFGSAENPEAADDRSRSDWLVLRRMAPYLLRHPWRVAVALAFLICAKLANIGIPILLKKLIDAMNVASGDPRAVLVVPAGILLAYAGLRVSSTAFTELRELVFAKVSFGAAREIAIEVFRHLHALSLRFHLERQTGGLTRDIERGTKALQSLVSYSLYTILPTLVEMTLVLALLGIRFDSGYVWIAVGALSGYIAFTVSVTEWRTQFRKRMNELDSRAHTRAIDALLNYETVKYFNNEEFEARRYDEGLIAFREAQVRSQSTLSLLNTGQQTIVACSLVAMLWRAASGVAAGSLTLGDLVMINAFLIQMYVPLNFLGVLYREVKQSLTDLGRMFLLLDREREVADRPDAKDLVVDRGAIRFERVTFAYEPGRVVLHEIDFEIPAGKTVAVVGASGSGKSTLARLLYRFYDVQGGAISIDGQDIRDVTQDSLRRSIGVVPQDTVLFNDTIAYNIAYGKSGAAASEVRAAARVAHIDAFIESTPAGYETKVGERGLKLSGGEKQRVAIARTLLKDPPILVFDEATSALDSSNEKAIQAELRLISQGKTALVVAHRLSTIRDAERIVVLDKGRIVEQGTHTQLIDRDGAYARMWRIQQDEHEAAQGMTKASASG